MSLLSFSAFAVAATLGAFLRYKTYHFVVAPWGTLLVNFLGSLLIGFLAVMLERYSPQVKMVFLLALLGSLTTFSTYSLELVRFFNDGLFGKGLLYLFLSNFLCFLSCFLGFQLAQKLVTSS